MLIFIMQLFSYHAIYNLWLEQLLIMSLKFWSKIIAVNAYLPFFYSCFFVITDYKERISDGKWTTMSARKSCNPDPNAVLKSCWKHFTLQPVHWWNIKSLCLLLSKSLRFPFKPVLSFKPRTAHNWGSNEETVESLIENHACDSYHLPPPKVKGQQVTRGHDHWQLS